MRKTITQFEYLLQRSPPHRRAVHFALLRAYYSELLGLTSAVLGNREEGKSLTRQILTEAVRQLERFPVGADSRVWIYRLAFRGIHRFQRWNRMVGWLKDRLRRPGRSRGFSAPETPGALAALPPTLSIPTALCHGLGLPVETIARVIGTSPRKIARRLNRALVALGDAGAFAGIRVPENSASVSESGSLPHDQVWRWIHEAHSLTGEDQGHLETHLATCGPCRTLRNQAQAVREALRGEMHAQETDDEELRMVYRSLDVHRPSPARNFRRSAQEISWLVVALGVILGAGWLYGRYNRDLALSLPREDGSIEERSDLPEGLPTPIHLQPEAIAAVPGAIEQPARPPSNSWDPTLSTDGRWIAFASSVSTLVPDDTNDADDVFVYDRIADQYERVSVSSRGREANGGSYNPDISGDGRFVVFTSTASNLVEGDTYLCSRGGGSPSCSDVFLHDRQHGTTTRLTTSITGESAQGFSVHPVISADGDWIAFWSAAGDLVPGDRQTCGEELERHNCLDVFLVHRPTGSRLRIPVGRSMTGSFAALGNLKLSADGRFLLLPIFASDLIVANAAQSARFFEQVDFPNPWDIFLYDRVTQTFEPINLSQEGAYGDEPSYGGSLSADGRWVAFRSSATNLVPGDDNDKVDIFLRDRFRRTVERLPPRPTESAAGQSGGVSYPGITSGERFIETPQISSDGRRVLFLADATQLTVDQQIDCEFLPICYQVYLYDQVTGQTRLVDRITTRFFPYASLSGDGNWIAFNADSETCVFSVTTCSDIYLYQHRGQITHPLRTNAQRGSERVDSASLVGLLDGHTGWVNRIAFLPDNERLVSVSNDGELRIWLLGTGEVQRSRRAGGVIYDVAVSRDGKFVAAAAANGEVDIWRTDTGALVGILSGHPGLANSVSFSPSGNLLAVGALRAVWLWDVDSGALLQEWDYPRGFVHRVAFSPNGDILAISGDDKTVWLIDLESGDFLMRLGSHAAEIRDVAFSPDGSLLATASADRTSVIWELHSEGGRLIYPTILATLHHRDWVSALAFSPDGDLLATGSHDGTVTIWDPYGPSLVNALLRPRLDQLRSVAFSSDGRLMAGSTGHGEVYIWDLMSQIGGEVPRSKAPGE